MALFKPIDNGPSNPAYKLGEHAYHRLKKRTFKAIERLNLALSRVNKKLLIFILAVMAIGFITFFLRPLF